jgi:aryl-alcohol dehydrogenase (NADP+)
MHTPVEETLSFLDEAVKAGKIQYVDLSNFTGWQLQLIVLPRCRVSVMVSPGLCRKKLLASSARE